MYAYCNNNPVNCSDPSGYVALVAGAVSTVLVAVLAVTTITTSLSTSKSFSDALSTSFQNIADSVREQIAIYEVASIAVLCSFQLAIENSKAQSTSKEIVNSNDRNQSTTKYWTADLVNKRMVIGAPITVEQASLRVSQGGDILCANKQAAQHILFINGYHNAVGPEIGRGEGFYWHYHPTRNHTGRKDNTHIWFLQ